MEEICKIKKKLGVAFTRFARTARVPYSKAHNYGICVANALADGPEYVKSHIPTVDKVLNAEELNVFYENPKVKKVLSYIERWESDFALSGINFWHNVPFNLAVKDGNDLTMVVYSNSRRSDAIKVVTFMTDYSGIFEGDIPEIALTVKDNICFVLKFAPEEVVFLHDWDAYWNVP